MFGPGKLIVLTSFLVNPLSGVLPICAGLAVSKYWPAALPVPSEHPQPFAAVVWAQVGPHASPPVPSEHPQPFAAVVWAQVGPHALPRDPPSAAPPPLAQSLPRTASQYWSHWARGAGVWLSTARKPCTLKKQCTAALRHWRPPVTERAPYPLSTADDPAAYRKDVVLSVPEPAAGTRRNVTAAHPLAANRPRTDSQRALQGERAAAHFVRPSPPPTRLHRHSPPRPLSLGPVRILPHPPSPLRDTLAAHRLCTEPAAAHFVRPSFLPTRLHRHSPPRPLSLGPVRILPHPPSPLRDTLAAHRLCTEPAAAHFVRPSSLPTRLHAIAPPVRTFLHPPSPLRDTLGAFAPAMRPTATPMQQEEELESLATPTEDDDTVTAATVTHEVHAPGKVRKTRKLHLRTWLRRHPLAAPPRLRPCLLSGALCRDLGHGGGILVGLGRR